MKKVAMVFNGIHFQQAVADSAFAYAKQSGGDTIALFLTASSEQPEGYGFPSDLSNTETITTDADAIADDEKIIHSNIRLLEHQATGKQITLHTLLLKNPPPALLTDALKDCGIIFIQGHDEHGVDTPAGIDVKKLLEGISVPIKIVR